MTRNLMFYVLIHDDVYLPMSIYEILWVEVM